MKEDIDLGGALGPEARSIIHDADGVDSPKLADKERVRGRLAAAIGSSIVGGAAATTAAAAKAGAGAAAVAATKGGTAALGGGLALKLLAGLALMGTVTAAYVMGQRSETGVTRSAPGAPAPASSAQSVSPEPSPEPVPGAPAAAADVSLTPAAPAPAHAVGAPRAGAGAGAPLHPSLTGNSAPAEEVRPPPSVSAPAHEPEEGEASLLQRARTSDDTGNGVAALDALDAHERRFPAGLLADQRLAERVVALCTIAKSPATRDRAERFLAERPRSQQADRIRRVCGLP